MLLITNRFMPTGGVMRPTSTTMSTRMPNQIANSSGVRPKSSAVTMGKNTGMVSRIMDNESMKHPSTT
ncbi:hypothetical protein D3C87_2135520 [compost metagenome]